MCSGQQTIHAIYIHVCNQGIYQGKSILHTKLKGRICKYILVSFLHIPQQRLTSASVLLALPYNVKIEGLSQEVYYHNMSIIIT